MSAKIEVQKCPGKRKISSALHAIKLHKCETQLFFAWIECWPPFSGWALNRVSVSPVSSLNRVRVVSPFCCTPSVDVSGRKHCLRSPFKMHVFRRLFLFNDIKGEYLTQYDLLYFLLLECTSSSHCRMQ